MNFDTILKEWEENNPSYSIKEEDYTSIENASRNSSNIELRIDLHGLTQMQAEKALFKFFKKAKVKGIRKVLIIHGRGLHSEDNPVLAPFVKQWLMERKAVISFGEAKPKEGGQGATWVRLRDGKNPNALCK